MFDWVQALERTGERGLDGVLVTVAAGKGSTPREPGAKMVVTADAVHGTIGGGVLEYQAIDIARGLLRKRARDRQVERFPLGASLGQVCGGAANLLFERVRPGAAWVRELGRLQAARVPVAIVMPTAGDAPGHLIVTADSASGTLGDAASDANAAALAREMLADSAGEPRLVALDGEGATVFAEVLRPTDFNVVLFGAGHVGRAIAHVLGGVPARLTWVDSRADEFPRNAPANAHVVVTDNAATEVDAAPPGSWFLVMTHSHDLDFELVERILRRGDFAYCGMIGSATKRRSFEKRLESRGLDRRLLERFTCPIGIAGIAGKAPGVIAVAVAAELLALRERAAADAVPSSARAG